MIRAIEELFHSQSASLEGLCIRLNTASLADRNLCLPLIHFQSGAAHFGDEVIRFTESLVGYIQVFYTDYWNTDIWWQKAIFVRYLSAIPFGLWGLPNLIWGQEMLIMILIGSLTAALWIF
ncbi:MAG: hypothetical protein J07HQX50_01545 [Haloquadratum sp. J07HQX50]|nr:MAG: hypothetical protein J07HQX50_01545 [Haloquadratum sp. J07HQX50]